MRGWTTIDAQVERPLLETPRQMPAHGARHDRVRRMIPAYDEVIIYDFGSINVCALTCQQLLEQMEARTMTAQIKSWSVDATRASTRSVNAFRVVAHDHEIALLRDSAIGRRLRGVVPGASGRRALRPRGPPPPAQHSIDASSWLSDNT